MTHDSLRGHYERKYEADASSNVIPEIRIGKYPINRFEAAVYFLRKLGLKGDVIELGAGNGCVAKALLESDLSIRSYTASDISTNRLKLMQNHIHDRRFRVLELDSESIPVSEFGGYNAVIMIAVIEHLVDPLRSMQQIRKFLRPSGFVYIDTPNIAKYTRRLKLLLGNFPSTASSEEGLITYEKQPVDLLDEGHLHYFTIQSLSRMLTERCGFTGVVKLGYHPGSVPFGPKIGFLFSKIWPEMFSEIVIAGYV